MSRNEPLSFEMTRISLWNVCQKRSKV